MKSKFTKWWPSDVINTKKHWAVGTEWSATSSNGKDTYEIEMGDKGFTCNCPSFRKCKHIKIIEKKFAKS